MPPKNEAKIKTENKKKNKKTLGGGDAGYGESVPIAYHLSTHASALFEPSLKVFLPAGHIVHADESTAVEYSDFGHW